MLYSGSHLLPRQTASCGTSNSRAATARCGTPKLYTLGPPSIRNTRKLKTENRNPKSETRDLKPETRDPKPETRNRWAGRSEPTFPAPSNYASRARSVLGAISSLPIVAFREEQSCVAERSRLSREAEWLRREALIAIIGMPGVRFWVKGDSFWRVFCPRIAPRTRGPKPETRNPKPETRNPRPETRNPKPETRDPRPETRDPKPETRNPKPEIRNPRPETRNTRKRKTKRENRNPKPETRNPRPET